MPRTYRRKVGGRPYRAYTQENMEKAIEMITAGKLSTRNASKQFNIPRRTLMNKLMYLKDLASPSSSSPGDPGRRTVLTPVEEQVLCSHIIMLADFGFPVTKFELRLLVKSYLDSLGRNERRFEKSNNMPGTDWAVSFVKRHESEISERMSQSISRYRAALDSTALNEYFDNLGAELDGIPPSNIWNYDETNLQDDPGSKRVLVKRGVKHPDIIRNATKASTSIMMCGNATGEMAPVYVVYKATNVYPGWMEGGPPQTRYNRSKSGWFDGFIFEDWFEFTMMPLMRRKIGTKVLIGDNLSSHLSHRVLNLCKENDIKFIALPPHSTHLLQPLDVSFFRPMKNAWRQIIDEWKRTPEGIRLPTVPKPLFPALLKKLVDTLQPTASVNLISGFRGTGIYPLDRDVPLSKLHSSIVNKQSHVENVSNAFMAHLEATRRETIEKRSYTRKKKVSVPPGKGITIEDLDAARDSRPSQPSGSGQTSALPTKRGRKGLNGGRKPPPKKKRGRRHQSPEESEEESSQSEDCDTPLGSDGDGDEDMDAAEAEEDQSQVSATPAISPAPPEEENVDEPHFTDFVAVIYKNKKYPGKMMSDFDEAGEACITAMSKNGDAWEWPEPPDVLWYPRKQVLKKIHPPLELGGGKFIFAGEQLV